MMFTCKVSVRSHVVLYGLILLIPFFYGNPSFAQDSIFFDFTQTRCSGVKANREPNENSKVFSQGEVTVATYGKTCYWDGGTSNTNLRFYNTSSGFTVSVPEDYSIIEILVTGTQQFKQDIGIFEWGVWTGNSSAVSFNSLKTTTISLKTLTVKYQKADVPYWISSMGYAGLYYSDRNLVVPVGLEALTYKKDGEYLKVQHVYKVGAIIPAGTPVVLKGREGNYVLALSDKEGVRFDGNILCGTDVETQFSIDDETSYFCLSRNPESPAIIGFYKTDANGTSYINRAHDVYLKVDQSLVPSSFIGFGLYDSVTSIEEIRKDDVSNKNMYNLQGQKVDSSYKGIIVINGEKYLNK